MIVILTSSTEQTQEELSALQEDLIPYVQKEAGELAPSPLAETVKEYTAQLALPPRRGTRNPFMEEKVSKQGKSFVRGRGYVDQRRWTRHFTASGTDGFRNKRVLNKKMRKAKEELSNWIVLFFFCVCYNYTKGEIQEP